MVYLLLQICIGHLFQVAAVNQLLYRNPDIAAYFLRYGFVVARNHFDANAQFLQCFNSWF